ncbi:hypothetical protein M431DRAFT_504736, partial [Trichoderma harzianum CBS 226.95]
MLPILLYQSVLWSFFILTPSSFYQQHRIQDETSISQQVVQQLKTLNQSKSNIICKENIRHCWVLTKKLFVHVPSSSHRRPNSQARKKPSAKD